MGQHQPSYLKSAGRLESANRAARLDHSTLCETEDFQAVRAEIQNVFADNESSAFCLRVHLCQFLAAMTTERHKIIAFDYLQLFQIGFAHWASGSFVVDPSGCNGSVGVILPQNAWVAASGRGCVKTHYNTPVFLLR